MAFLSLKPVLKQRLNSAINAVEDEVGAFSATNKAEVDKIMAILQKARAYAAKGEIDAGWNEFHLAEYHLLPLFSETQRRSKAESLIIEAPKLGPMRQKMVETILNKKAFDSGSYTSADYTVEKLLSAWKVRDDYYNTRAHKIALKQTALNTLAVILFLNLAIIVALAICIDLTCEDLSLGYRIAIAVLFGTLGAGFSMAHSIMAIGLEQKIYEQLLSFFVTIIRLTVGAASALIAVFLLKAGVLDGILNSRLLNSVYAYIILAFIAGFLERWVLSILKIVGTVNEAETKGKS